MREPLVELVEVLRNDKSIVPDIPPATYRERVGIELMRASVRKGRDELISRVQQVLALSTKQRSRRDRQRSGLVP